MTSDTRSKVCVEQESSTYGSELFRVDHLRAGMEVPGVCTLSGYLLGIVMETWRWYGVDGDRRTGLQGSSTEKHTITKIRFAHKTPG